MVLEQPRTRLQGVPVSLVEVSKRFGSVLAVDRVSLEVRPGELMTLLGPSGCGKSTTLRMIAGLEPVSGGRILIGGEDVTDRPAYLRDVTMVFQSYALFPHMTVFENVAYGLRTRRRPEPEVREAVASALRLVGLQGLDSRLPGTLSGGQQQRVAVARALVMKPKVLLFDEPLSNLDAKLRRRMRGEIRELQRELGITTVYVTHDQSEALAISDRIVVMNRGRIEQVGTPAELYRRPATRFVAEFVGEANFLPVFYDGESVVAASYRLPYRQDGVPPGPATLMVRPEAITFSSSGLPGVVRAASYLGSHAEFTVDTPVGPVSVNAPAASDSLPAPGSRVQLSFQAQGLCLFSHATGPAPQDAGVG